MAILTPKEVAARLAAASIMKENASDADASKCVSIYPDLKGDGSLIKAGTRVNVGGVLYRSRHDVWDTGQNHPECNPNAWEKILYREGFRVIEEAITAEHPVLFGERVWFGNELYESTINGVNTYTPITYPTGWKFIRKTKV